MAGVAAASARAVTAITSAVLREGEVAWRLARRADARPKRHLRLHLRPGVRRMAAANAVVGVTGVAPKGAASAITAGRPKPRPWPGFRVRSGGHLPSATT